MPRHKLIAARHKAMLTQEEVAEKIKADRKAVNKWKRGVANPQPAYVRALCDLFHVDDPDDLLVIEEDGQREQKSERQAKDVKPRYELINYRKMAGLTEAELAIKIGTDAETLRRWEAGTQSPFPHFVKELCTFFKVKHPKELNLDAQFLASPNPQEEARDEQPDKTTETMKVLSLSSHHQGYYRVINAYNTGETIKIRLNMVNARIAARLSQKEVADKMRVNATSIVNWERAYTTPHLYQVGPLCETIKFTGTDKELLQVFTVEKPVAESTGILASEPDLPETRDGESAPVIEEHEEREIPQMHTISLLKQERLKRHWSRDKVEAMTEARITTISLTRWENSKVRPRPHAIDELCKLYGKTPEELGLDTSNDIMGGVDKNSTTLQEGIPPMSDLVRRAVFANLGSRLTSLVDLWPRRNYQYAELQEEMNRAILDYNSVVAQEPKFEFRRRDALKTIALIPLELVGGVPVIEAGKIQKTDTDLLLKHCAAGITACGYLRRGKELTFISDVISLYISFLAPLIYSHSETYQKASARLLAQSFGLKSKLVNVLQGDDQAIAYEEEAIRYAQIAESVTEEAVANREMALLYWRRKRYKQALPYAEKAYRLAKSKDTPKIILSFTASGLSFCQATSGRTEAAQMSLKEAHDHFDPEMLTPLMPYNEVVLFDIDGVVYRCTGNFKEAIDIYERCLTSSHLSALGAIEQRINYTKTEVSRDDVQNRNMDLCVTLLTDAIKGARELNSKWYKREARETFDLLRIAWPREDAIKKLGKDHFGL